VGNVGTCCDTLLYRVELRGPPLQQPGRRLAVELRAACPGRCSGGAEQLLDKAGAYPVQQDVAGPASRIEKKTRGKSVVTPLRASHRVRPTPQPRNAASDLSVAADVDHSVWLCQSHRGQLRLTESFGGLSAMPILMVPAIA